jgi:hypothetical protein
MTCPHFGQSFAQYGKITKTTKVTALYVLQDEARQSYTEDLKVGGHYRPLLNPQTVIFSVFVIFKYCANRIWQRAEK